MKYLAMLLCYPARCNVCACVRACVCAYVWVSERMLVYFSVKISNKIQTDRQKNIQTCKHTSRSTERGGRLQHCRYIYGGRRLKDKYTIFNF